MAHRAKISSSCLQVSPKVVGNGKVKNRGTVSGFDAEDLADERSTSVGQYKTASNKCQRNCAILQ